MVIKKGKRGRGLRAPAKEEPIVVKRGAAIRQIAPVQVAEEPVVVLSVDTAGSISETGVYRARMDLLNSITSQSMHTAVEGSLRDAMLGAVGVNSRRHLGGRQPRTVRSLISQEPEQADCSHLVEALNRYLTRYRGVDSLRQSTLTTRYPVRDRDFFRMDGSRDRPTSMSIEEQVNGAEVSFSYMGRQRNSLPACMVGIVLGTLALNPAKIRSMASALYDNRVSIPEFVPICLEEEFYLVALDCANSVYRDTGIAVVFDAVGDRVSVRPIPREYSSPRQPTLDRRWLMRAAMGVVMSILGYR